MGIRICKTCVLPESQPYITLNEDGICNLCEDYQKNTSSCIDEQPHESDFVKKINKYRGKKKYDCLVMCSGGKDSTASLYFIVKRYKLNPLAFTFDHGFETSEALDNVHRAVEKLGVDFLFFKTDKIKKMFSHMLKVKTKAVICHPCSIWYMDLAYDIAARFDIPIIIAGWTKGQATRKKQLTVCSRCGYQSDHPEFELMSKASEEFLQNIKSELPEFKNFPSSIEEVVRKANKKHKCEVLSPHWFLPYDSHQYIDIIKQELDWKPTPQSYPMGTTNCELNFLSAELSMKYFNYTHYHVEVSKMIRDGLCTREEALKNLELQSNPELLEKIIQKLK